MISRAILLALCLLASGLQAAEPKITAEAALLFDANSGRVLYKKNENEHRAVASTQKLLTSLIIAESGSLSQNVIIDKVDTLCDPTKLYLTPGDAYSRRELLTALLVKSPNDVARALARDNSGSIDQFAAKMNDRMAQLGGADSHFVNPNGLPAEGQFSTARDMARVARAVYFNPVLREIISTRYFPFTYASGKVTTLQNTNRVLRNYSFCNGMKTGYTDAAGHCLISSASWNGQDMIAIVYGETKARIWEESARLLAWGLNMSETQMASLKLKPPVEKEE